MLLPDTEVFTEHVHGTVILAWFWLTRRRDNRFAPRRTYVADMDPRRSAAFVIVDLMIG
jgi:hypothetical protein